MDVGSDAKTIGKSCVEVELVGVQVGGGDVEDSDRIGSIGDHGIRTDVGNSKISVREAGCGEINRVDIFLEVEDLMARRAVAGFKDKRV